MLFNEVDYFYEKIESDEDFFLENCLDKIFDLYFYSYLPELILKNYVDKNPIVDLMQFKENQIMKEFIQELINNF